MTNQIPEAYENKFVNGINHPYLYLWDSWSYIEDDTIHLYCLAISRIKPNGEVLHPNERNDFPFHIRHFTSIDNGVSWIDRGCFLKPEDIKEPNYRTIWSGSIEPLQNGKKLMAYTGLVNKDSDHFFLQNIGLGLSNNGFKLDKIDNEVLSSPLRDWEKIIEKGYFLDAKDNLGSNLGEIDGPIMAWRDPFIFIDKNNKVNLFLAAKTDSRTGAIARLTLKENNGSYTIEKLHSPSIVPDITDFTQLEVPKIIFDDIKKEYYLLISSCNRLYESQPDSEISKEVRVYTSKNIDGPWQSLGDKILGKENLFGLTVLKPDFKNDRLLCVAPYTEAATKELMLTFAPTFYIYLNPLRVEFLK